MKTDAHDPPRRLRFAEPQPIDLRIDIEPADIELFAAINRHAGPSGGLPSNYLHWLTKHVRKNESYHKNRLTQLYNGYCPHPDHKTENKDGHVCKPVTYLTRHPAQFNNFEARYQPLIYSLTPHAYMALGSRIARPFRRSNSFVHDLFLSCFTASLELSAHRFIFRDEILEHPRCPKTTEDFRFDELVPDDLFGIEYPEGGFRFFALEVDRATERVSTRDTLPSSITKKVQGYVRVLDDKLYKDRYGLPTLSVIFATTNEARVENMRKIIPPHLASKFLFKAFPAFGDHWRVPREILPVLGTYKTADREVDISKKAPA